ncbi:MAG: cbb3-type cytochrome c oxidase subunit II [Leptospiraceae bacterium]|nr:cbb3-type cytochrome c oxidase subunit II [Leptospiraceae bacterium]
MKSPFKTVSSTVATTVLAGLLAFGASVVLPFGTPDLHGKHQYTHAPEDILVLKGQEVYYQEGCQYCHTQGLRAEAWEIMRFSNVEKLGYFPAPAAQADLFFSPSVRGSRRIGPDLSHVGIKMDKAALTSLLQSNPYANPKNPQFDMKTGNHSYSYLFDQYDLNPLAMSWKVRWLMNFGLPLNDPYQRSAFPRLEGKSRGEALVEYLNFLGSRQTGYEGEFYQ